MVPFHLWTPDVYQGAPAPVTAYIATVSKGAMFALLLRFFYRSGAHDLAPVFIVFSIIAIASMIVGNLLALLQNNVKRILALDDDSGVRAAMDWPSFSTTVPKSSGGMAR